MKNRLISTVAWIAFIALLGIGLTRAFFSSSDSVTNIFTIGNIALNLDEPSWTGPKGENTRPDIAWRKDPTVTAEHGEMYMRVKVELIDRATDLPINTQDRIDAIFNTIYHYTGDAIADGGDHGLNKRSIEGLEGISPAYNPATFSYQGFDISNPAARYYEYMGIFSAGDIAELFTHVIFATDADDLLLRGDEGYNIVITAEAIGAEGYTNAADAFADLDMSLGGITIVKL